MDDLTKVSRQLRVSFGSFMYLFDGFGIAIFLLLIFLLTKQIIEKSQQSISMAKILGFNLMEISGLYLVCTFVVVVIGSLVAIPIIDAILRFCFSSYIYTVMAGYIPYIVSSGCYVKMVISSILCFVFVAAFMMMKIHKISKSEALKNVE